MEIYLIKGRKLLHVLSDNVEFTERPFEGAPFRRRFGDSRGVTFTFEETGKGLFLFVNFDRYKDPGVLRQVADGQSVEELQVLWKLAHLPRAKIFGSKVMLPDGRSVELIDTVGFELRKVWEGVWESEKNESDTNRCLRQMRLNRLRDEVPGIFSITPLAAVSTAGKELLFSDTLTQSERGAQSAGELRADNESTARRTLEPEAQKEATPERPPDLEEQLAAAIKRVLGLMEQIGYPPREGEPEVDAASLPEKRNPGDLAECDGCNKLFYEGDLSEIKPGVYLCDACYNSEMEVKTEFKKPTAEDINKAIQLLLWRCRDAQIHKNEPRGKKGFYRLDDWISKANDDMIRELGLWCADIQELNIGTRDS